MNKEEILNKWREDIDYNEKNYTYYINRYNASPNKLNDAWLKKYADHYKERLDKVKDTYEDYINHNSQLSKCELSETRKVYNNYYSLVHRETKEQQRHEATKFMNTFCEGNLAKALTDSGIGYNPHTMEYRVMDTKQLLQYVFENLLKPKFEEAGIKGVKLKKNISINSYGLFDFTDVEFNTNKVE